MCWAWAPTHLSFLQQSTKRALPDDVAPAQKEAHPKGHHHHQEEATHNAGGNGWDLGPGTRGRHGKVRLADRFHYVGILSFLAFFDTLPSFNIISESRFHMASKERKERKEFLG